jgi:hypothetical protein
MIALDAVQLYDLGFGEHMLPVTHPDVVVSPASSLRARDLGKAPGKLTSSGWVGVDPNAPGERCHSYKQAKLWRDTWHANVGLVGDNGLVLLDNDQGSEFSRLLQMSFQKLGVSPLRRYVQDPRHKHDRDAWLFAVCDFIGDPITLDGHDYAFRRGVETGKLQLLGKGKQLVVSGTHRGTRGPYVLDRPLPFQDLPQLSVEKLDRLFEIFMKQVMAAGWRLDSGPSAFASVSQPRLVSSSALQPVDTPKGQQLKDIIANARALLAHLPNRETPPGATPTPSDVWLDEYENYRSVAYTLAAHLGPAAWTAEARDLFLDWALGRPQDKDPAIIWSSILRGQIRFGSRSLVNLLKERGVLPSGTFPDIQPDDPLLKTPPLPIRDRMVQEWAHFTRDKGGFIRLADGRFMRRDVFSDKFAPQCKEFAKELGFSSKKDISFATLFCLQKDKTDIVDWSYAPGEASLIQGPTGLIFNHWQPSLVPGVFNRWAPIAVGPIASMVKPWLDHVDLVLGPNATLFVKHCALIAQRPELKPNWHFLVLSRSGLGKDMLIEPLRHAVGEGNYHNSTIDDTFGQAFNEALRTKFLAISEAAGSKRDWRGVRAKLNQALASPPAILTINPKFMPKVSVRNCVAVIMFANDSDALRLDREQRRVFCVNRLEIPPEPAAYYTNLDLWLKANSKLVASYLLSLPLSQADIQQFLGRAPKNDDTQELEERNVETELKLLEEIIEEARQGTGQFASLLATSGQLASVISSMLGARVIQPRAVHYWLLDMERRDQGVGRLRKGNGGRCEPISAKGYSAGRLWHLDRKSRDGRDWSAFGDAELLALRDGKPVPPSAKIIPFNAFPSLTEGDEKI